MDVCVKIVYVCQIRVEANGRYFTFQYKVCANAY